MQSNQAYLLIYHHNKNAYLKHVELTGKLILSFYPEKQTLMNKILCFLLEIMLQYGMLLIYYFLQYHN